MTRLAYFVAVAFVVIAILVITYACSHGTRAEVRCYWQGKEWVCEDGNHRTVCWRQGNQWVCR